MDIHLENKINLDFCHSQKQLKIHCDLMHVDVKVKQESF